MPAMKRLSSVFKKKEKKSEPAARSNGTTNGTNGLPAVKENPNGTTNGAKGLPAVKEKPNGTTNGAKGLPAVKEKPNGTFKTHRTQHSLVNGNKSPINDPSDGPDHSINRDGMLTSIEKFGKVFHLAGRPLPSGAGDGTYINDEKPHGSFFDDLKSMKVRDFATLHMLLEKELNKGELTDDKTMAMERVIQLVSNLPANSENRVTLTNTFVGELWDSLGHPPDSMLGDKYVYRQADGSWNNIQFPDIGKAGTPYARSVTPHTIQPNPKPDPGLIFDSILSRENGGFKPHPNNISSMLYYIASIVIHDCFRTSHTDFNISETSSYLDLSPLYGSNQEDQDLMRTFKDGKMKPDCFAEKRLLGFPPGVGCILIMFNRFHNYVVEQLAQINENNRFKKPRQGLTADQEAVVWKKYDNDLFQTGRLITCGLYINIILLDYLRTIVGLNRTKSTWTLDPRVDMTKGKTKTPRGTGNQCSVEFNLVYRWHSCISQRDENWSKNLYQKLFQKDYKEVGLHELLTALGKLERMMPDNPPDRDFNGLKRNADGTFSDDDLVEILADGVEDLAGASGPNNVPDVLRAVEILGQEQARAWKCATLNEFRAFFGLKKYETFDEISSDPKVSSKLRALFEHPDFVELYPGLVCEDAKVPMDPGVGIAPTYTISRAILSDAVTLVRGDRFYTTDYHPGNLTNWGHHEVAYDLSVNQGCVFYKLFIRAFPNHFTHNSIYAHYPLTIPSENHKIMEKLSRLDEFSFDRPSRIPSRKNVTSYNGVTSILKNGRVFSVEPWRKGFYYMMGKPGGDFMLAGDGPFFKERREQMGACLYQANWHANVKEFYEMITLKLLKQWSNDIAKGTKQVDIIRDVGNSAHVYFASNVFSLPLKSEAHPKGVFTEHELYGILALIFVVIHFGDVDPVKTFPLRTAGLPLCQALGALVEQNVGIISKTGLISGLIDPLFMEENNSLKDYGVHMIRQLLKNGLGVHETTWSQVLPTAGAMVANQAQVFGQIIDFYTGPGKEHLPEINRLAKLNTDGADDVLLHYVMEAIRLNGTFGAFRKCKEEITIDDGDGKRTFKAGDLIFVGFVELARDPNIYPQPELVRLDRPIDSYIVYGIGPHSCLGGAASRVALTAMLKVVGRLDNFRAAPGAQGQMKKIPRPGGFYVYMDALQSGYFPFPTTMKVQWDGGWNEPGEAKRTSAVF